MREPFNPIGLGHLPGPLPSTERYQAPLLNPSNLAILHKGARVTRGLCPELKNLSVTIVLFVL